MAVHDGFYAIIHKDRVFKPVLDFSPPDEVTARFYFPM